MHETRSVVSRIVCSTNTQIPDALENVVGIDVRSGIRSLECCLEKLAAHRDETANEVGMKSVGAGAIPLQRASEPMFSDEEIDKEGHPCSQGLFGRRTLGEEPRAGVCTRLNLMPIDRHHKL